MRIWVRLCVWGEHFKCKSPDFVMLSSMLCICWVLAARILDQPAWSVSKVRGQPAGAASWWQARAGWIAHYSWKKEGIPAPRIIVPKVFTKLICLEKHCLRGHRRVNAWMSGAHLYAESYVCECGTTGLLINVRLMFSPIKRLIGNRWEKIQWGI